jgi:Ca2+-binding RTX toxin-like protein
MTSFTPIAAVSPASVPSQKTDNGHIFGKLMASNKGQMNEIYGTERNDNLDGTGRADQIAGFDGSDWIEGGRGNDHLTGGAGEDVIIGDNGNDFIDGEEGNDTLSGGNGADTLKDTIVVSNDPDKIPYSSVYGGEGQDSLDLTILGSGSFVIDEQDRSGVFRIKYANGQGNLSGIPISHVGDVENLKINGSVIDLRDGQTFRVN